MTTTNDREWAFLAQATNKPGPFNDMYFRYLRGLGYTGTLQDMIAKSGKGLTPSKSEEYSAEAVALFARFTSQPNAIRKGHINTLILALKSAGVWAKLDALYIMAAHDSQAARQNWIANQYNLTPVSSPTFTVDRGYRGDGSSSYLDTNLNPATASMYQQNNANIGVWVRDNISANIADMGNANTQVNARDTGGSLQIVMNAPTNSGYAVPTSAGHSLGNRTNSAQQQAYKNGAPQGLGAQVSTLISPATFFICRRNGGVTFTTRQYSAAHVGSGLSDAEVLALYNALSTYLTAVGA